MASKRATKFFSLYRNLLLLNHVFKIVQFQFYFLICSVLISYIKYIALKCYPYILYYWQYSSADIRLHLHSYNTEGSMTYRPFGREISHPTQKRTLRLPAIKTALKREKEFHVVLVIQHVTLRHFFHQTQRSRLGVGLLISCQKVNF
jgi:hypothetical protein